jgi:F-type H+-transporting ATPase subunit gamma
MAKSRVIVKRRQAVQNIRKITRTMQLIATARFQAMFNRTMRTRPYSEKISALVSHVAEDQTDFAHPLLHKNEASGKARHLLITSNRGLCGGYNGSLIRAALEHAQTREAAGQQVDFHVVGNKGVSYFRFLGREMVLAEPDFPERPPFALIERLAISLMDMYAREQIDAVYVTYMKFISSGVQQVETMQLLPVEPPKQEEEQPRDAQKPAKPVTGETQYEFIPGPAHLLAELLPEMVEVCLFQSFMDAAVSEQVARMVAMRAASDAANDMIRSLTRQFNRARQNQITLDLLDVVSGAEALQ